MDFKRRWVLVTGASSGLGQSLARKLAVRHGANIVAVARRKDRLDALAREIESAADVKVHTIAADLSKIEEVDRVLAEAWSGRNIYGAVLNAGVTHYGPYDALSWESFDAMLRTNVVAVVRMTHSLVGRLVQESPGGGVLIVASMAGINPVPYQTAYSATKAFLVHYGLGLWHELQGKDVSITTYAPGGIVTEMTAGENFNKLRSWLAPVEEVADDGIEAFRTRRYLAIPGTTNQIGELLFRFLPRRFVAGRLAAAYRKSLQAQGVLR
jgi:hypothetical protein